MAFLFFLWGVGWEPGIRGIGIKRGRWSREERALVGFRGMRKL
jgi:hypothetical protein